MLKCNGTKNKEHIKVLKSLLRDRDLLILRPDKGYGIVLLDRKDYLAKMNELISDGSKFESVKEDLLKIIFKLEDKQNRFLLDLGVMRKNYSVHLEIKG